MSEKMKVEESSTQEDIYGKVGMILSYNGIMQRLQN